MAKIKVSVTIEEHLLEQATRDGGACSRSQIIENALAAWVRSKKRRCLEEEMERYYLSLPEEERDEDESWARLGDESLRGAR